jgi:hypothetical protein
LWESPLILFSSFYIWPPEPLKKKSIVLVPRPQVEQLFATINKQLRTRLKIPDYAESVGFVLEFPNDGTPRARYLGRADEREMAEYLKQAVPDASFRNGSETPQAILPTERSMEAFKKRMETLLNREKNKTALRKERKKAERIAKQKKWNHSVKLVQRYLGIREQSAPQSSRSLWAASTPNSQVLLNLEDPAPFARDESVIFISVDVESYERDHNQITEIGIATLDTNDIEESAPGKGGRNWFKAIRARHFRIKEHGHLNNTEFVHGCADRFQFG